MSTGAWSAHEESFLIALGRALSCEPNAQERWIAMSRLTDWIPFSSDRASYAFAETASEASLKAIVPSAGCFSDRQSFRDWISEKSSAASRRAKQQHEYELENSGHWYHDARQEFLNALTKLIAVRSKPHVTLLSDYSLLRTELRYFIEVDGSVPLTQGQIASLFDAMDRHTANRCISFPFRMYVLQCFTLLKSADPLPRLSEERLATFADHWQEFLLKALPEKVRNDVISIQALGIGD